MDFIQIRKPGIGCRRILGRRSVRSRGMRKKGTSPAPIFVASKLATETDSPWNCSGGGAACGTAAPQIPEKAGPRDHRCQRPQAAMLVAPPCLRRFTSVAALQGWAAVFAGLSGIASSNSSLVRRKVMNLLPRILIPGLAPKVAEHHVCHATPSGIATKCQPTPDTKPCNRSGCANVFHGSGYIKGSGRQWGYLGQF